MKHEQALGIVLKRLNYGEADRIITILTDTHGKVTVMARAVRKEKSKLAGGIELLSVSQVSFIPGKREIGTLVSTRLKTHYKHIVKDIGRTNLAFEILKIIDKVTEAGCEPEYFELLTQILVALDDTSIPNDLIESWFSMRLLRLLGHEPNLTTDNEAKKLESGHKYNFDYDHMAFFEYANGNYTDKHIKLLRLLRANSPQKIMRLENVDELFKSSNKLLKHALQLAM